jgi:hypothetical protein
MAKVTGKGLIFLITVFLCFKVSAQSFPDIFQQLESQKPGQGAVKISQDNAIHNLVELHLSQVQRLKGIRGFRIAIYMGSGQEANKAADASKAKFISRYEDVKSYKKFEYPYFKIYVGDFRTKSEALRFLKQIENEYPDAFIREFDPAKGDEVISFPNEQSKNPE